MSLTLIQSSAKNIYVTDTSLVDQFYVKYVCKCFIMNDWKKLEVIDIPANTTQIEVMFITDNSQYINVYHNKAASSFIPSRYYLRTAALLVIG